MHQVAEYLWWSKDARYNILCLDGNVDFVFSVKKEMREVLYQLSYEYPKMFRGQYSKWIDCIDLIQVSFLRGRHC